MSGDKEATSEQSLVRERAGYDEIFHLDHKTEEGFSWLLKRETSAHSLDDKGEVMMEGKVRKKREKRVRMKVMREERMKNTGEKMTGRGIL